MSRHRTLKTVQKLTNLTLKKTPFNEFLAAYWIFDAILDLRQNQGGPEGAFFK